LLESRFEIRIARWWFYSPPENTELIEFEFGLGNVLPQLSENAQFRLWRD
jgi:hypothetical protein